MVVNQKGSMFQFDRKVLFTEEIIFMIAYDLQCINGHGFEGWFEDAKAYDAQKKQNLIACPVCNEKTVSRVPSTFAIKSTQPSKDVSDSQTNMARIGQKIVDFVEKNT